MRSETPFRHCQSEGIRPGIRCSFHRRKDSLTEETYKLLYPGIAHWRSNLLVCRAGKRLIRVDEVGDDLRYIAWGEGKTISDTARGLTHSITLRLLVTMTNWVCS